MGLRYLIAVPRDGQTYPVDLDAKMVNAGFQRVEGGCRCWVYLNHPDRWAKFADEGGIIVGDLFEKHTRSKPIFAGRVAPHAEDLDTLVRAYWGGYVALRSSVFGLEFFRDPSGILPAYRIDCPEGYYLTSDLPLLVEVGLYAPRISWPEVAWFYYTNGFPTPNTALVGVEQIRLEEDLTIGNRDDVRRNEGRDVVGLGLDDRQTGHRTATQVVGQLRATLQQAGV